MQVKIFATAMLLAKLRDADTVVEKLFGTKSLDAILVIQSERLKLLADATPQAKFACIWETESSYNPFQMPIENVAYSANHCKMKGSQFRLTQKS